MQLHLAVLGCDPSPVISPKPTSNEKIDGEFGGSTPDSLSGKIVASVSQGSRGSPQSPKPGLSAQVTMFSVPFSLRQRDLIRRPFTGTPAHACINTKFFLFFLFVFFFCVVCLCFVVFCFGFF